MRIISQVVIVLTMLSFGCGNDGDDDAGGSGAAGTLDATNSGSQASSTVVDGSSGEDRASDIGPLCANGILEGNFNAESDADMMRLSECTSVNGSLEITASEITDLDELSGITTISGSISIQGQSLTNIDGLSNVKSVGGHLIITGTGELTDLNGLNGLQSIGENLSIMMAPTLVDLHGLSNLASIGGVLTIANVSSLPTCEAEWLLENLGLHDDDSTASVCGTMIDDCGGDSCSPLT